MSASERLSGTRLFVSLKPSSQVPARIALGKDELHYLARVLRLEEGSPVNAICRESARIFQTSFSRKEKALFVNEEIHQSAPAPVVQSLIFCLCKGKKNDLVCEKVTELGARRIIFWQSSRSVKRLREPSAQQSALNRWRQIAEAASRQCGRITIPEILFAENFNQVVSIIEQTSLSEALRIRCSAAPSAPLLRNLATSSSGIHLLIGPEGDLSDEEVLETTGSGFTPASLGCNVLRAETAAIAAVAQAEALWGSVNEMSGL